MPARIDLVGMKFGRLSVLAPHGLVHGGMSWKCHCDCGAEAIVQSAHLRRGRSKSCGCLRREMLAVKNETHGGAKGEYKSRLYRTWKSMRARTTNPGASFYYRYGGRGISVCPEWADFSVFRAWAEAAGYQGNLSLDRIDNNGHYEPANCRWATQFAQSRNSSKNVWQEVNGQKLIAKDAAKAAGLSVDCVRRRLAAGWSEERALTEPPRKGRPLKSRERDFGGMPRSP